MAAAESCTGGLIAAACTALAGSSDWFERGFVTYSNEAKTDCWAWPGAAAGARRGQRSRWPARWWPVRCSARPVQLAVAVTGIAGPGGAVAGKPVGTVWVAWGTPAAVQAECLQLGGDRDAVRGATVHAALSRLLALARAA
jgi:nicotinamide-nucleotide amidase